MVLGLLGILVCYVQAYVVQSVLLHLTVYGTCHDIAWSQASSLVILLHELFSVRQTQDTSIAAHGLGNEVGRMSLLGIIKDCGMELHKLHILHLTLGTIYHGNAIASGYVGIGGCCIDGSCTSCGHQSDAAQVGVHLARIGIQDIRTIAFYVGGTPGDTYAQMMLRDDLHGEMIFQYLYGGMIAYCLHEAALYLGSCVVGMMQDT